MAPCRDCALLNSGHLMPIIGLGTGALLHEKAKLAVRAALDCGYRAIDTAYFYKNEEAIGEELQDWISTGKLERKDIFITTKLPPFGNRAKDVEKYLSASLKNLKLNYVDLYLIHFPFGLTKKDEDEDYTATGPDGLSVLNPDTDLESVWKAMEEEVYKGRVKSIGISNFNSAQIDRIMKVARIPPANHQIEVHAYLQQKQIIEHCKKHGITVCAYSPRCAPHKHDSTSDIPKLLDNPVVTDIAKHHGKTPSQVLLRFLLQTELMAIPRSSNPQRIKENIELDFHLTGNEMMELKKLDRGDSGRVFLLTALFKGVENHKEYPFSIPF